MQSHDVLVLHAVPHPVAKVQRAGFPLDHPYLEQCWVSVVGPSAAAFLRRMPLLWQVAEPARIQAGELASSLGIESRPGIARTVRRLVQFGLARQPTELDVAVFAQLPALPERFLRRAPKWVTQAHHRLLEEHRRHLESPHGRTALDAADIRARLDRHRRRTAEDRISRSDERTEVIVTAYKAKEPSIHRPGASVAFEQVARPAFYSLGPDDGHADVAYGPGVDPRYASVARSIHARREGGSIDWGEHHDRVQLVRFSPATDGRFSGGPETWLRWDAESGRWERADDPRHRHVGRGAEALDSRSWPEPERWTMAHEVRAIAVYETGSTWLGPAGPGGLGSSAPGLGL